MLVNDKDAQARLNSPGNLINRMKDSSSRKGAMSLFGVGRDKPAEPKKEEIVKFNPFLDKGIQQPKEDKPITSDDILDDADAKIKLAHAHDRAIELLTNSVMELKTRLNEVKPEKLPGVIIAASKTIESIRRERLEALKNNKDQEVHYHFYTPEQKKIEDYEVIEVT